MADTTFVARVTPIIAVWLNDVNVLVYRVLGALGVAPVTVAALFANLGVSVPARAFGFLSTATAAVNLAALQAAINALGATSRGGDVTIGPGSFSVASGVTIIQAYKNITITGAGVAAAYETSAGGTTLNFTTAGIAFSLCCDFTTATPNYACLRNLNIHGGGVGTTGIKARNNVLLEKLNVSGFTTHGIWLSGGINGTKLRDVSSGYNVGAYGLLINWDGSGVGNTTFSVERGEFRVNAVGVRIEYGSHYKFDTCTMESNTAAGTEIYKAAGANNDYGIFDNCWWENNFDGGTGYQITFDSQTHTPAFAPEYFTFRSCMVNAQVAEKCIHITDGSFIRFDNFQGVGAIDLEVNSNYVSFWNQNGGTITDNGNRNWTGYDGQNAAEAGGPNFSDINVGGKRLGTFVTPAYSAGNFTGSASMTWTVDAGDVTVFQYLQIGYMMTVNFDLVTTTVGGTPDTDLMIKIPLSKVVARNAVGVVWVNDNGGGFAQGAALVNATGTNIIVRKTFGGTNWGAGANTTYVQGQITFEVTT